ncbi:MAG: hypothetical protein P0Y56_14005 [Candidatus Andeanibacterium colombiense]|uniref:Uncharacterized protein n=1 Tax=Candidatus Andeanibacterium colombiense TaxID=3121345 RepID=A0AAJ6BM81_9SPHN|nr:MAG: hypothetical protein P0Y56_14005 [Sphingomonadaceae bacterium]
MKIATSIPQPSGTPQLSERFDEGSGRERGSFAEMLAAMLSPQQSDHAHDAAPNKWALAQQPDDGDENSAPDCCPRIGASSKSFAQGRLLVEIALNFRGPSDAQPLHEAGGLPHARLGAQGRMADSSEAQAGPTLCEFLAHWAATFVPPAVHAETPSAAGTSLPPIRSASTPAAASVSRGPPELPARQQIAPERGPLRSARQSSAAPAPPTNSVRNLSPFGAQLIALESGLRLVLRLPRLAGGERTELEAQVSRLLEQQGHHRHEIVIHEIARGEA